MNSGQDSEDRDTTSQQVTAVTAVSDTPPSPPPEPDFPVPACHPTNDVLPPEPALPAASPGKSFTLLALASLPFAEFLDGFDEPSSPPTTDLAAPTSAIISLNQKFALLAFSVLPFPQHLEGPAMAEISPTDILAALASVTSSFADQKFALLAFSVLPFAQHTDRHAEPVEAPSKISSGPDFPTPLGTPVDETEEQQSSTLPQEPILSSPPAGQNIQHHVSHASFCPPKAQSVTREIVTHPDPEAGDDLSDPQKRTTITPQMRRALYRLLGNPELKCFLLHDGCRRVSDKYLLAMVLIYFSRAGLSMSTTLRSFMLLCILQTKWKKTYHSTSASTTLPARSSGTRQISTRNRGP